MTVVLPRCRTTRLGTTTTIEILGDGETAGADELIAVADEAFRDAPETLVVDLSNVATGRGCGPRRAA